MRLLALDAATEACSVALLTDQGLIGRWAEVGRGHAQQILGMVEAVLAEGGVSLSMLDAIAASVGPGAFTGVRLSVSIAQGLAFGAGLPVVPITTLEALALQVMDEDTQQALACLDARMGEVYWGCFVGDPARGVAALVAPTVGPPEQVRFPGAGPYRGVGRGFAAYPALAQLAGIDPELSADTLPDARHMARLGALRLGAGEGMDPAELQPQYLRDKVALTEQERAARNRSAQERAGQNGAAQEGAAPLEPL
jgi:tRNA threonylcarbamoyladenosine biosynthesis protein TsaB